MRGPADHGWGGSEWQPVPQHHAARQGLLTRRPAPSPRTAVRPRAGVRRQAGSSSAADVRETGLVFPRRHQARLGQGSGKALAVAAACECCRVRLSGELWLCSLYDVTKGLMTVGGGGNERSPFLWAKHRSKCCARVPPFTFTATHRGKGSCHQSYFTDAETKPLASGARRRGPHAAARLGSACSPGCAVW